MTDIAVDGKSPVSSTPIAMHAMLYGARRLLHNLHGEAAVYPFQPYREDVSRLYEIYPGHGWKALKLKSSAPDALQDIPASFKTQIDSGFEVTISAKAAAGATDARGQANQHARDAVMACIQMAYCLRTYKLESGEPFKPEFASEAEWQLRVLEGLVVRMLP